MDLPVHDASPRQNAGLTPHCAPLSGDEFGRFCEEIREQPAWRVEADRNADYYDGNQIDAETAAELERKGMGPLIVNMVKPTVDMVLGTEAKSRTDWRVQGDNDQWQDVAEALSAELMTAERESRADRACSDAHAQQVKSGIGWVEVSREQDPFQYGYRAKAVHRREIYWDWASKEPDLWADARYQVRKRWYPIAAVTAFMPQHAELISAAGRGLPEHWLQTQSESVALMNSMEQGSRTSLQDWEWRNMDRNQVCLYEVWYKRWVRGTVIRKPDGRAVEFDPQNMMHVAGVARGVFKPEQAVYSKTRVSLWLGPFKLQDVDAGTKRTPYVPFIAYKEDLTGVPYGLIRAMVSSQDEINARRRKLLWLLSAKMLQIDSDALDTKFNDFRDIIGEIARPDAVIVTNPNRRNANGLKLDEHSNLSTQQFQVMEEAKRSLQEAAGVYNAMLGDSKSGATSGIAVNSLIDQGMTTLAELTDNYRYARRLVGEALLELIIDDMKGKGEVEIIIGEGARRKVIILNKPTVDPVTGVEYLANDVSKAPVKVALEDVPTTPAYRAQQNLMFAEVLKSSPPEAQAILFPSYIESSELPNRQQLADDMRKAFGLTPDTASPDPEKQQMAVALEQMQRQMAEMGGQLQQAQQQLSDRAAEHDIKRMDLASKEADREAKAVVEAKRLELERTKMAQDAAQTEATAEQQAMTQNAQTRIQAQQLDLERARLVSDDANRDKDRQLEALKLAGGRPSVEGGEDEDDKAEQ
jgi:hypothetical protein